MADERRKNFIVSREILENEVERILWYDFHAYHKIILLSYTGIVVMFFGLLAARFQTHHPRQCASQRRKEWMEEEKVTSVTKESIDF